MTDKDNAWKFVPLERSYDMRARAILAFNTATANGADRDDALQAAWEAEYHAAPQNRQKDTDSSAASGDGMATQFQAPAARMAANFDDYVVEQFAVAMKRKLADARDKGRGGWNYCTAEDLSRMLREHVEKGDPRDVANFCMFLWYHGAPIAAPAQAADTEIEALFEGRAENSAVISANHAANSQRAEIIARAVAAHGRAWPEQLTSGVMFYEGERITKAEFLAEVRG